jgi:capsular exopolysaccharide synthesis family protein
MTTLPQPTAGRLPRPAHAASDGNGTVTALAAASSTPVALQMTPADAWRVVRSHAWMIAISVLVSAAAGVGLYKYLDRYHQRFTATGLIEVQSTTFHDPLQADEPQLTGQALSIEQRTQAQRLQHDALFTSILQNPNSATRQTGWFRRFGDNTAEARAALRSSFDVRPIPESKLLQLTMTAGDAREARDILVDVVNQHLLNQQKGYYEKQLERSRTLNEMKRRYEYLLGTLQQELREKVSRLSIDGMGTPGRLSTKEAELQDLLKSQFELQREQTSAGTAYEALVQQQQTGLEAPRVEELVKLDPSVQGMQQTVTNLDIQIAMASQDLGEDHPGLRRLTQQREAAAQALQNAKAASRATLTAALVDELKNQVHVIEESTKALETRITDAKADMGELNYLMADYLAKKDEAEYTREMLKEVNDQLDAIKQAERQTNPGAAWYMQPEVPDEKSFPRPVLIVGAALVLGLALALGIAFLREMMDSSVRSPRDVHRVGQLNLLGMVPHLAEDPQATGGVAGLPLVIAQAPHSVLAEQFRQIRTRLQHAVALHSVRSILVTSPGPGDGKTTVACNLAAGLALSGRRVLLVDANFRRPALQGVFAIPGGSGFTTAMQSPQSLESSIIRSPAIANLAILPCGPRAENVTEMLEGQLFTDLLDRALEEFDHVIFDGGPLLYVSEAVAMAARVDGVVSVVRAKTNSRGLLQRMRDSLRQLNARHIGVVLNAVRHQAGGYYTRNIRAYYAYQNAG